LKAFKRRHLRQKKDYAHQNLDEDRGLDEFVAFAGTLALNGDAPRSMVKQP
jgi:hypothetical protein